MHSHNRYSLGLVIPGTGTRSKPVAREHLVEEGGAGRWGVTWALRVEVLWDATRGSFQGPSCSSNTGAQLRYPSSVWGGGTRRQVRQAPAGVTEEEEELTRAACEPSRMPHFLGLSGSFRGWRGNGQEGRTRDSVQQWPPRQGNHRRTRVRPRSTEKGPDPPEVIFPARVLKDAWRSWEGTGSHLGLKQWDIHVTPGAVPSSVNGKGSSYLSSASVPHAHLGISGCSPRAWCHGLDRM